MVLILTLLLFVIVGPTVVGILIGALLSLPTLGYEQIDVMANFGPVAGIGALVSLPICFVIALQLRKTLEKNRASAAS